MSLAQRTQRRDQQSAPPHWENAVVDERITVYLLLILTVAKEFGWHLAVPLRQLHSTEYYKSAKCSFQL
jgi:hypothetical protein